MLYNCAPHCIGKPLCPSSQILGLPPLGEWKHYAAVQQHCYWLVLESAEIRSKQEI